MPGRSGLDAWRRGRLAVSASVCPAPGNGAGLVDSPVLFTGGPRPLPVRRASVPTAAALAGRTRGWLLDGRRVLPRRSDRVRGRRRGVRPVTAGGVVARRRRIALVLIGRGEWRCWGWRG